MTPHTRELLRQVLGFDPGQAGPTTGYGRWLLERLGMGRLPGYAVLGDGEYLALAGRRVRLPLRPTGWRQGGSWDAAVVLASLVADDARVSRRRLDPVREQLLAAAAAVLSLGVVDVEEDWR